MQSSPNLPLLAIRETRLASRFQRLAVTAAATAWVWFRRRVTVNRLAALDDHQLKDIGLGRGEIDGVADRLARDRTHRMLVEHGHLRL